MTVVPIKVVRFADEHQPGWVECELLDATGHRHTILEKIPVVTREDLWRDSEYPCDGVVACEVVSTWVDEQGRSLTSIDTSRPWGVESTAGITQFVVFSETLHSLD
jgi:hypothetical protein